MSIKISMRRLSLTTGAAAALLLAGATAATAAPSSGDTAAVTRTSASATPGVVLIESKFRVDVRLRYHDMSTVSGFRAVDRTYTVGDWVGSGFVVTPNGAIVTASHVVDPPMSDVRHYAVNKLFESLRLGYRFPQPMDAYRITDDRVLNTLLQQCYRGVACRFTVRPEITAYPATAVGDQIVFPTAMPAQLLERTGVTNTDVAVLKVDGEDMPTVELARSALDLEPGSQLDVLGFPGSVLGTSSNGTTTPTLVPVTVSSVRPGWGAGKQIQVQGGVEHGESGGPVLDAQGRVVGLVSYGVGETDNFLRTVDDINAALRAAGIAPARGPIDAAYQQAMSLYWARHYSDAVKAFRHVLDLDTTHPLAQHYLSIAAGRAGTEADVPVATSAPSSGAPLRAIAGGAAFAAVAGGLILLALRRRRAVRRMSAGAAA